MNRLQIVFVILCMSQWQILGAQDKEDGNGFDLVKQRDHVSIYERWIQFPKSNPPIKAREVKGVFHAKTSPEEALALIQNENKIKQWQSHVSKFKVYPQTDTTWYEYSYHDIPWPVSDQDHFLVYEIEKRSADSIFVTFESIAHPTLAPVDKDADRMKLAGSWLFERKEDKVKITYSILSMPSNIPRIFTDPVIRTNMMNTIREYIKILEK